MKNSVDTWKSQDASIKNEFGYSEIEVRQDEIISFLKNGYNQIKDVSRDDFYYSEDFYDLRIGIENCFNRLSALSHELLRRGDYAEVINLGREVLSMLGIEGAEKVSVQTPSSAIVLTEAINLAAKEYDSKCYWLKPAMIVASWKLGADFGIGEDNAYYLGTPTVGVASFHDPGDEVGYLVLKVIKEQIPVWGSPWSGLIRQDDAHEILKDFYAENSLVEQYAEATSTEEMQVIREKYFNTKRTATALEISKLMSDKTD